MRVKNITNGYLRGYTKVAFLRLHPERYLFVGEVMTLRHEQRRQFKFLRNLKVYMLSAKVLEDIPTIVFQIDSDKKATEYEKRFGIWEG